MQFSYRQTFLTLLLGLIASIPAFSGEAEPPRVVLPQRVSPTMLKEVSIVCEEFKLIKMVGVTGQLKAPKPKTRAAIISVLIDQKLIPATTPLGAEVKFSDKTRLQIMFALQ